MWPIWLLCVSIPRITLWVQKFKEMNLLAMTNTGVSFEVIFVVSWILFSIMVTFILTALSERKQERESKRDYPNQTNESDTMLKRIPTLLIEKHRFLNKHVTKSRPFVSTM